MTPTGIQITQIISDVLDVPETLVTLETPIRALPNVESIRVLQIILKVEKLYGIEVPDDATFRLETVGEFVRLVDTLSAAHKQPAGQLGCS